MWTKAWKVNRRDCCNRNKPELVENLVTASTGLGNFTAH
jgi:hypothetical protein